MTPDPYPGYRHAGLGWLDAVPEGWSVEPLRNVTQFTSGWTPPTGNADSYDGAHLWANISDLGPKSLRETAKRLSAEAIQSNRIPVSPKGSLLFSFKLTIGSVSIADEDMYTNEAIATFRASDRLLVDFAYYSLPICVVMNASENIYGAPMLNARLIRSARIVVPPTEEQRQIADFLDVQTAKIDALIGKQEQLIETLAERRQAVISHAVTKGLDANAPMKDSGIYWLGAVPDSWSVRKFSQVTRINGGQVDPRIEPYRLMTLIAPNHIEQGTGRLLARETAADQGADSGKYLVREGQVIYSKIRPALRKAVIAPEVCLCSADMYGIDADTSLISNEFLLVLMLSRPFTQFVVDVSMRVAMPKVNRETLSAGALWFPEHAEQARILEYLNRETAQIDALSTKAREMIDVLKERRQALISAAVTGKIDVRGL